MEIFFPYLIHSWTGAPILAFPAFPEKGGETVDESSVYIEIQTIEIVTILLLLYGTSLFRDLCGYLFIKDFNNLFGKQTTGGN